MSIDIGNGKLHVNATSRQFFCNLVTSKGQLIEKVVSTLSNDMNEDWKEWHVKIIEDNISVESWFLNTFHIMPVSVMGKKIWPSERSPYPLR